MKQIAPLSKSQLGIYAECVQHENEVYYNLPFLYVFDGSIDADRLCRAIEMTIQAHPVFFTRLELSDGGEPIQTIDLEKEEFSLSVEQVTEIEAEKQKFIEPFKLYGGRLFHAKVMRDAEHVYWFIDLHHIISDGSSLNIIIRDVETAYNGGTLAPEEMSMQEYALAEAEMRKTPAFEEDKQWYAQNFDCGDTFTQLIPDLEGTERHEANMVRVLNIDKGKVEEFCKANGIYKNTLFTTAYAYLLAKYNNEHESLFTTVYNGRTEPKLQHSVGMTVKTLPVYAKFTDETTVLDFLKDNQEQMEGCRKHELYAYTDLMTDLNLQSNSMFAWQGEMIGSTQLMGKPMQTIQLRNFTLEVPFCLTAYTVGDQYHARAEYNSNKYSEALIAQFMESYEAVLEGFLGQTCLRDIDICTKSQCDVLDSFNQTDNPYDDTQTVVSLFRRQAKATPEKTAVVFKDKRFTYAELDEMSDHIASYIASKGLGLEDVVAILIARSEWMVIASLGVLKAGCAYQPLDPSYPAERLNFMMKDTASKLLIADEELCSIVDEYKGEVLFTKDIEKLKDSKEHDEPKPESLFTLIYTSGSTGVPKGCQLEHRNVVAFSQMHQHALLVEADSRIGAYASFGFDACLLELWPPLIVGATVYIIPEEIRLDLIALNDYFEQNGITHTFMTTQVARSFVNDIPNHSLKAFITGGEKLADVTPPPYLLLNGYGPSECICYVTAFAVKEKLQNIPIGKAVENMHLYIMDA